MLSFLVNECEVDNGGCDQVCVDAVRSYKCSCEDGYTLDQDGRGCTGNLTPRNDIAMYANTALFFQT